MHLVLEVIVHGKAFDQILAQYLCGPDAELDPAVGIDSVADADDYIEIIVCYIVVFAVSGSCCKKCNN